MAWIPANYNESCSVNSCSPTALFLAFLVQYFGHSYDPLLDGGQSNEQEDYDFIIVGAGSAGCVVDNRLSEITNWKILLLEAGDEEPLAAEVPGLISILLGSSIDYAYRTIDDIPVPFPRGKVMGGTSAINGMWYVRGSAEDYDGWARSGNEGWSWEEVLPYFKKSENAKDPELLAKYPQYHGTDGYLTVQQFPGKDEYVPIFVKAFQELGLNETDSNSGNQIGVTKLQFTNTHGSRLSTNGAFIRPIRGRRPNLVIQTKTRVTKLIFDQETNRAIGVEYEQIKENRTITQEVYATKEVILSAGVVDTPKILLLSGIGPAQDLQELNITVIQDLPVGQNLQNHALLRQSLLASNGNISSTSLETRRKDLVNWLTTHDGPWSKTAAIGLTAFYQTKYENLSGTADVGYYIQGSSVVSNGIGPYFDNMDFVTILLSPRSRGYLKLNKTDPRDGQPEIRMNLLADPQDQKVLLEGLKFARRLFNSKALKDAGLSRSTALAESCQDHTLDSDEYLECLVEKRVNVGAMRHPVGTCKMGPANDRSSVVDQRLKVHHIHGLRIIDGSVMPDIVRGNTNAPIIMIAEKGSDFIKSDWL